MGEVGGEGTCGHPGGWGGLVWMIYVLERRIRDGGHR